MTQSLEVDFGKAAEDYATHRQGYPPAFLSQLESHGVGATGQNILDLGCGTGLLSLALSRAGAAVTGIDPSPELLAKARQSAETESITADFVEGVAEELPFEDGAFDVVTAATSWHWFDPTSAAQEAARVLTPEGRLVIAVMDWHAPPGSVVSRTLAVVHGFSAGLPAGRTTTFHYPRATSDLIAAGFVAWDLFGFTTQIAYSHGGWRGRVRASQRVGPVMSAETLAKFDAAMAAMLAREFPQEPLAVDHRLFALIARKTA